MAKYLFSPTSNFYTEVIVIYCDMVYDLAMLREEIAKVVQEEYIPKLIKVDDVSEYMFVGGIMLCVQELSRHRMKHVKADILNV